MTYTCLPPVGRIPAPELEWIVTANESGRWGRRPRVVFQHRWSGGTFEGVLDWFRNPASQASSHIVYAGELGDDAGKAAQMVHWARKAWTECAFNPIGISIESADAVWLGSDPSGFARLARITALLLHLHGLPARPLTGAQLVAGAAGFCRHADGGAAACGHFSCPTTDAALWRQFSERVVLELRHGGFRTRWGR